ncbi:MAG TPA: MBL fold metallo-hydrolase, partial [Gammaproteobacteria bacterium]
YLEALQAEVLNALRSGLGLEDTQKLVRLDQFSGLGMFKEWMPLNVEGLYRRLSLQRRGNN